VNRLLPHGTLWEKVVDTTSRALCTGALYPIPTRCETVEEGGVSFLVRVLTGRPRKDEASARKGNPFLPHDEALFVGELTDTHICLLNKYNVVEHHLLAVTRQFEDQEEYLTEADFAALLAGLAEYDCLAFYNGGVTAGASQRHKHLQFVPLPLAPSGPAVPLAPLVVAGSLPFRHAVDFTAPRWIRDPLSSARDAHAAFHRLLREAGMEEGMAPAGTRQSGPYNLLVTRSWMLLVPRSREYAAGSSVNALGFAGALLVRDDDQLRELREAGVLAALASVAFPKGEEGM
jgi:ATP adenylyltransferase